MLKRVIDDTYEWFVGLVADRRKMPVSIARLLADGSIYSGRQALKLKLVDEVEGTKRRARGSPRKNVSRTCR